VRYKKEKRGKIFFPLLENKKRNFKQKLKKKKKKKKTMTKNFEAQLQPVNNSSESAAM